MTEPIGTGEIHFFYGVKLDTEAVSGPDDVQRLSMALVPTNRKAARLFIVGRKKLPEIVPGESDRTGRNWLMLSAVDAPRENEAAEEVIDLIEGIPDRKFGTMADVIRAVGEAR